MQNAKLIGLSSVQHFLVDGLCICCMFLLMGVYSGYFGASGDRLGMWAVLTYNVLAFMSQPLTGLMADRMKGRHWLLIASSLALTLSVACASLIPMLMAEAPNMMREGLGEWLLIVVAVLLGAGNSLFHVWGGKQTVVKAGNDIRALGVFVSTGALGLAVGLVCRSWGLLYGLLLAIVVVSIVYMRWEGQEERSSDQSETYQKPYPMNPFFSRSWLTPERMWLIVVSLMLFVAYRSFAGEVFSKGITKSQMLILTIGFVSMLGKMAGGWIALKMGVLRSLAAVLAGVALCIVFRGDSVMVLLGGIFLMNCTMPVTLFLANDVLAGREGLAFGLLAAALIPGYLMAVYL